VTEETAKKKTAKKETAEDVLKGLVEEVRALRKEVALTKETYTERLKKNLPSSSFLPFILQYYVKSLGRLPNSPPKTTKLTTFWFKKLNNKYFK